MSKKKPKKPKKTKGSTRSVFATETETFNALSRRYCPPDHAIFRHVRDAAGFDAKRTIDAMAMGMWKSRGLHLHGFEIKVRRGDWLRELKDPAKQESIARYVDRFWLVVGDADIVKDGELPERWGLLIPRGDTVVEAVKAPVLQPDPMPRTLLASILRRAHKESGIDALESKAREEAEARVEAVHKHRLKELEDTIKTLTDQASAPGSVDLREMGEAFALFQWFREQGVYLRKDQAYVDAFKLHFSVTHRAQRVRWAAQTAARLAKDFEQLAEEMGAAAEFKAEEAEG